MKFLSGALDISLSQRQRIQRHEIQIPEKQSFLTR
jgi:hypothetical protein